ncbi:P-loop NTPase fold protein [Candidatus Allofournierella merdipullorum]|uniref:KAP family P-loop NTPase fold protein n=1 Tax=Candidatus Allofournierella merdipullorum TaxID=2838595 RepID=UPI00374E68CF
MHKQSRTFEEDDLFGREPYAKFLEKLILNSGQYHRDDDMKAYTIAVDSPWGTGKSVFLEKFENMLQKDCPETIRVVHYNAWQNDFWKNAFEPFADAVFRSEWFWKQLADEALDDASKYLLSAVKNVGLAFLKTQLSKVLDIEYMEKAGKDFGSALTEEIDQAPNSVGKEYRDYTENLRQLQDAMEKFLKKNLPGGKLVIVIDELDRRRPTFAIDTLEIVKHIMDVPNVVYLFALDVKQLGAAVKQVYGADTDTTGYLMRFFSYYSRLPKMQIAVLVRKMIEKVGIEPENVDEGTFVSVAKKLALTARDFETVERVYQIMLDTFLKRYNNKQAFALYWLLLCKKYKQPIEFQEILSGKSGVHFFAGASEQAFIKGVREKLLENRPMKTLTFVKWNGRQESRESGIVIGISKINDELSVTAKSELNSFCSYTIFLYNKESMSGLLFEPDLERWDEIKHLTPGEFLAQQMEMYNFIPEIE